MICPKCATGADLMEAAVLVFKLPYDDPWGGPSDVIYWDNAIAAMATAAAINRLHAQCEGGQQGCGCQHRGTGVESLMAGTPTALITSPAVSA